MLQSQQSHTAPIQSASYTVTLLKKQLKQLEESKTIEGVSVGLEGNSLYSWNISFAGPSDTLYEGGYFQALMKFPEDYPNSPPTFRFQTEMWHPNIYTDGRVCISILHAQDEFNDQEPPETRWRPILTPEDVLISIVSILSEPNINSPANVDAGIQFRDRPDEYKKKVRKLIDKALENL
ncbi:unnamed protein product [Paramecium pentaurelia]|uniref:UBC core domain-containing protein n=1 Tax=Paramecium pentaurelia TaxID=43138 RepID=A0A8S1WH88_9CILI|nr:unnamed protein product [Paramecium pentaurelia]